jgi:phytoene desaturase
MSKCIVIGAGIGGLASALRLRAMGHEVRVFESYHQPGGKLQEFTLNAYRFDAGPSLFTLPHLIDELFELFGENPRDHFDYEQKRTVCNYFWDDGDHFSVSANESVFIEQASSHFGEPKKRLKNYLLKNRDKYHLTAPLFIEKSLHKLSTFFNSKALKAILNIHKLDLFSTLNKLNKTTFDHPKLVQLFNRYATYNGSDPYQTSGIMSMIPHLEMGIGTFFPKGGMYSIVHALYGLAKRQGILFDFNTKVEKIAHKKGRITGVIVQSELIQADIVVSNMDVFSSYRQLMPDIKAPEKKINQERSCSAIIFYWGVEKEFPELDLHNILFSSNYKEEFKHIFKNKDLYSDPTVYINITSKDNPKDAPKGCENWFILVNAPYNDGQDWDALIDQCRNQVQNKIKKSLGIDIKPFIAVEKILDPREIESRTSSYKGALYGTSSNSMLSAFWRHPNFHKRIRNLYFCGGSVHPGGGIPLCLNSAKIVGQMIRNHA